MPRTCKMDVSFSQKKNGKILINFGKEHGVVEISCDPKLKRGSPYLYDRVKSILNEKGLWDESIIDQ